MIAALRQIARQRGVTLLRLIQIAAGVGLEESVLIEHVLAYAGESDLAWKSQPEWQRELGISRAAIRRAHQGMPQIGINVSVGPAGGMVRITRYLIDWDILRASVEKTSGESDLIHQVNLTSSSGQSDLIIRSDQPHHQVNLTSPSDQISFIGSASNCSSSSSEKETQESEESLTTTTSSTPTAYELLIGAGVYPTIANRYRDHDPDAIRRLIRYANDHAKLPAAFIAAALLEGFTPPARQPTQDELYYDFIER